MSNELDQLKAITAFGKVGIAMLQARMLSLIAEFALAGLCGFVAYSPTWHGVTLCGILALVAISAFRAEMRYRKDANG